MWRDDANSPLALLVYQPLEKKFHKYLLNKETTIGRKTKNSVEDIQLDSSIVSRKQGRIYWENGFFIYEDSDSTNGTYINGILYGKESHTGKNKKILEVGDVIRIDHRDLLNPHAHAVIIVVLQLKGNILNTKSIDLSKCEFLEIGRSSRDYKIENKMISEKHAYFAKYNGRWHVNDCDSTNGVYVNNSRIAFEVELYTWDVIRIADYIFVFTDDNLTYFYSKKEDKQLVISIEERSVRKLFNKQILLQDINISVSEKEMVMILGGSGAGKTTFLNAVLGYERAKGVIEHNNLNVYRDYNKVRSEMGFVPQQDLLRLEDTVYATLSSAAEMKMNSKSTKEEREERIDHVLNSLGLSREKNSIVKKLSGGQRKRLSIAVELVSNPSLFFLDEPDSGLDGIMAKSLMQQLRNIADEGKIVMVITHAPDRVRDLFDKVLILAKGERDNIGHLAFFGPIEDAMRFFDTDSLEGIIKRINRIDEGGEGKSDFYIDKFKKYQEGLKNGK